MSGLFVYQQGRERGEACSAIDLVAGVMPQPFPQNLHSLQRQEQAEVVKESNVQHALLPVDKLERASQALPTQPSTILFGLVLHRFEGSHILVALLGQLLEEDPVVVSQVKDEPKLIL